MTCGTSSEREGVSSWLQVWISPSLLQQVFRSELMKLFRPQAQRRVLSGFCSYFRDEKSEAKRKPTCLEAYTLWKMGPSFKARHFGPRKHILGLCVFFSRVQETISPHVPVLLNTHHHLFFFFFLFLVSLNSPMPGSWEFKGNITMSPGGDQIPVCCQHLCVFGHRGPTPRCRVFSIILTDISPENVGNSYIQEHAIHKYGFFWNPQKASWASFISDTFVHNKKYKY